MASYWFGILFAPIVLLFTGVLERWGWEPLKGFGIGWLVAVSFLFCTVGTVFMTVPSKRKILLFGTAVVAIPMGVLLSGLLLIWIGGLKGIQ